jgi:hypothetical protein
MLTSGGPRATRNTVRYAAGMLPPPSTPTI